MPGQDADLCNMACPSHYYTDHGSRCVRLPSVSDPELRAAKLRAEHPAAEQRAAEHRTAKLRAAAHRALKVQKLANMTKAKWEHRNAITAQAAELRRGMEEGCPGALCATPPRCCLILGL